MNIPIKAPVVAVITGCLLGLVLACGIRVPLDLCAGILFGTGLIAWTADQYAGHLH